MKAVIQRVSQASVAVNSEIVGEISKGTVVLLGVEKGDSEEDALWLAKKIAEIRMFGDSEGKMNLALQDTGGSVLAISQFTLAGNCAKGRRPSFTSAAPPDEGNRLYQFFIQAMKEKGLKVETGIFRADMKLSLINDGPVTFILESRREGKETE